MPNTGEHLQIDIQDEATVSMMLAELRQCRGIPNLELMAEGVVQVLTHRPGVQTVTFAINPSTTDLLDSNWQHQSMKILIGGKVIGSSQWQSHASGWPTSLPSETLEWGTQHPSLGAFWPSQADQPTAAKTQGDWVRFLVQAREQAAIMVTVCFDDSLTGDSDWNRELNQVQQMLQLIVDHWVGYVSRELELTQLTSQKQALSRLNRLQGRFVAMASHEFKTPLTSITAYADALSGQFEEQKMPLASEFLGVIRTEASRLLRMVNRILDFSRMEYGAKLLGGTAHDLKPLIEETILSLRPTMAAKQLTCDLDESGEVPRAIVDADLIRQVLINLVGNAVKFTPKGGRISVDLQETESSVEVGISDTGPGIPQRDIHRIFREFFRSGETAKQEEGTGLGLTIVRHIINLHGGSVEAQQRLGGGSVFTFRVPKEVHNLGPLPNAFIARVGEDDARRLLSTTMQLIAEMVGAKRLVLLLSGDDETMVPVAGFGWLMPTTPTWTPKNLTSWQNIQEVQSVSRTPSLDWSWYPGGAPDPAASLLVPLHSGQQRLGCLVVQSPTDIQEFQTYGHEQLSVLGRVIATAINELTVGCRNSQELSGTAQVTKTTEALRSLLQIRRNGVPTAAAKALHLLGLLAQEMDLPENQIRNLKYAAALHDAGMARVEDEILLGESELSFDERDEVDRHVEQGVDLMSPLLPSEQVAEMIRHHHERFDGSGFPNSKQGSEIPLGSRLLAVIDTWFSLTSGRSYRLGLPAEEALHEIKENAGSQFDPRVVAAFEIILQREGCLPNIPLQHGPVGFGI